MDRGDLVSKITPFNLLPASAHVMNKDLISGYSTSVQICFYYVKYEEKTDQ